MKHNTLLTIAVSAALSIGLGVPLGASADEKATLIGADENPPVVSEGAGKFKAMIKKDRIEFTLDYDVASDASDILQAHLHVANPGNNGSIAVFLCTNLGNNPAVATQRDCPASPGKVKGDIVADDILPVDDVLDSGDLEGFARLLEDGATYANVHTDDHRSGEVRGQVSPRKR